MTTFNYYCLGIVSQCLLQLALQTYQNWSITRRLKKDTDEFDARLDAKVNAKREGYAEDIASVMLKADAEERAYLKRWRESRDRQAILEDSINLEDERSRRQ